MVSQNGSLIEPSQSGEALPLSVSELVLLLKADVEEKHRNVAVVGEVSSFKQWRSGHCYFDIKDSQAVLPAVMFRPHFLRVPFQVADGMEVLFRGKVSIYAASSRLQMIVESMEPLGQGALLLAFEQGKKKLLAEGLFDLKHKKAIRAFNQCVGLITSSHGAVLRDMVRILKGRMPKVDILFSPVRVQGEGAAQEIAVAIELLDNIGACDVIIVGRGGGSLEDLWAFNEETVVRAIFKAKTPIISAVGHENDHTLSDLVADMRAATPTHAATMVVPDIGELQVQLSNFVQSLTMANRHLIKNGFLWLMQEKQRVKDPRVLLFRHWQTLDESTKKLKEHMRLFVRKNSLKLNDLQKKLQSLAPMRLLRLKKETFFAYRARLYALCPSIKLQKAEHELKDLLASLTERVRAHLQNSRHNFTYIVTKLEALSPLKVLSRGYSVVQREDGRGILSKKVHFTIDQLVIIRVEDGAIKALVQSKEE